MRTTVRIKDDILQRAKKRAHEEGRTLTSLVVHCRVITNSPIWASRLVAARGRCCHQRPATR